MHNILFYQPALNNKYLRVKFVTKYNYCLGIHVEFITLVLTPLQCQVPDIGHTIQVIIYSQL